jgi:hypothetical protein
MEASVHLFQNLGMTNPDMSDYWNKSLIIEEDRKAYHSVGWLTDSLESSTSEVDIPTFHHGLF